jgi:hypothetical protein
MAGLTGVIQGATSERRRQLLTHEEHRSAAAPPPAITPAEQPCRATLPSNPAEQPCANPFVDLIWSLGARLMIGLIIPAGLLAGVFVFLYIRRMAGADHAPRISAASRAILANASLKSGVSVE